MSFSTGYSGLSLVCFWLSLLDLSDTFTPVVFVISLWQLLSLLQLPFIPFYFFPFFSFAFPISLAFPSCFLPNHMHHFLLFWLFFPRAESQQFCLCGHLYSPESSPTAWDAKPRKVTFLGSLCSQLEEMEASRR